jgi:hypothetical protein
MKAELDQLLEAEEAAGSPIRRYLRPGLPESEVVGRLAAIGLAAPADLAALYGWRDGTDQEAWEEDGHGFILEFFPYARFSPLDTAIADYLDIKEAWQQTPQYQAYLDGEDPGYGYWLSEWFPVFESEHSRHAINLTVGVSSPVWHVYFEPSPPTRVYHDELRSLVEDLTRFFNDGSCYWDGEEDGLKKRYLDSDI